MSELNIFQRVNAVMQEVTYVQKDKAVSAGQGGNYKAVTEAERDRRIAAIEALPVTQDDLYIALNNMTLRRNEAALGLLYAFVIKGDAESVLELLMKQAESERASRAIDEANDSMEDL